METTIASRSKFLTIVSFSFIISIVLFQSCQKAPVEPSTDVTATDMGRKKNPHNPPPPPPPPFYFSNCNTPTFSATFNAGVPTNMAITKNYTGSPGGNYGAFTSATVNGITITAPAGTFNVGSGSVVFTATGTPINTGYYSVVISVGNIQPCMMYFMVTNAPASGPTVDPGSTVGSTGTVNFIYKGQSVTYTTVRARDGKIWLQQNLGSPQVAFHLNDEASYGDYFQWGRWDDGHQLPNSPTVTGGPALWNPSSIPSGNSNFIVGTTSSTRWWGSGAMTTDTWSGATASSTNGKDPCVALGPGWRLPTAADWNSLKSVEDLDGALTAFMSNLKFPAAGFRDANGGFVYRNGDINVWSSTASNTSAMAINMDDNTYLATINASDRGQGYSCRCVKD